MAIGESLGKSLVSKLFSICLKYSYKELSKDYTFFKVLKEFKIEYPKDEYNSSYLHTTILFAATQKPKELIELILLEESIKSFKEEIYHKKKGVFERMLNANLHTNRLVKEIKHWNEIPHELIEEFFEIYDKLVKDIATPVQNELLKKQNESILITEKGFGETLVGINNLSSDLSQQLQQIQFLLSKPDVESKLQSVFEKQLDSINKTLEDGLVKQALNQLFILKNDIWNDSSERIKFRLLTNIGVCYFKHNDIENASKYLIEAYSFNPNSEVALTNVSNAYYTIGHVDKAKEYLNIFFSLYPDSINAHALSIKLKSKIYNILEIEEAIPDSLKQNVEILTSLGVVARENGKYKKSIWYLEEALKFSKEKDLVEEHLLSTILEKYRRNFKVLNLNFIDEVTEKELRRALELCDDLIIKYESTEIDTVRVSLLQSKCLILNVLGYIEEALEVIDDALKIKDGNSVLLKHKGFLLALNGNIPQAKITLEKILDFSDVPDVPCLLAEIYRKEGMIERSILLLEDFINKNFDRKVRKKAKGFLVELLIETNQVEKINSLILKEFQDKNIYNLVYQAKVDIFSGKEDAALKTLQEAIKLLPGKTSIRDRYILAEELLNLGCINHSIEVFNSFIDKNINNELTIRVAKLYYLIGEKGECLKILQNLRNKYGVQKDITPLEISIYQEYGDYENAKVISENYLFVFPDDLRMKIRITGINLRLEDFEQVDKFLNEEINIWNLTFEDFKTYLAQLKARNLRNKIYRLTYEYRRIKNNSQAHILYMSIMFQVPLTKGECEDPKAVVVDSVITLINSNKEEVYFIIEDRSQEELVGNEINLQDEKFSLLKNRKVGDVVLFNKSSTKWIVQSLTKKLVFAFKETQKKCETIYSEESPFHSFSINDFPKFLERHKRENKDWQDNYNNVIEYYKNREAPFSMVASFINKNPITLWDDFTNLSNIGIQVCYGNNDEWNEAFDILQDAKSICADILSLLTLFELGIEKLIISEYGKLIISSSTYDLIYDLKQEVDFFSSNTNALEKSKLDLFSEFVKSSTVIRVPTTAITMNSKEKERLDNMLGVPYIDTFLLAKETGSILLCEDLLTRSIAKHEHSLNGVWIHAILRYFLRNNIICNQDYQEKVIKLAELNYLHTAIDENTLLAAAKQCAFKFIKPFSSCMNILIGGISSDSSSLIVAYAFLYRLWLEDIIPYPNKEYLTLQTITVLCTNRKILDILDALDYILLMNYRKDQDKNNNWIVEQIYNQKEKWKDIFQIRQDRFFYLKFHHKTKL